MDGDQTVAQIGATSALPDAIQEVCVLSSQTIRSTIRPKFLSNGRNEKEPVSAGKQGPPCFKSVQYWEKSTRDTFRDSEEL